jgi:hypothetical protein
MLVPFDPEVMKNVCDRELASSGAETWYHALVLRAVADEGRITHLVVSNGSRTVAVGARVFIDCTGNGDVAFSAGVPFTAGSPDGGGAQPMTTVFRLGGIDVKRIADSENPAQGYVAGELRRLLAQAEKDGLVPPFGGPWVMRGSTLRSGEAFVNMVRQWGDPTDIADLSRCEAAGREDMFKLFGYLKEHAPAFRDSYIIDSGASIGIRDSRHFIGRRVLSLDDCLNRRSQPDSVAVGGHIVDIHSRSGDSAQLRRTIPSYEIPYGSLLPLKADNLLLAGRIISLEYELFASVRVMATCMAIGQGAGEAAAVAAELGVDPAAVPFLTLAARLDEGGVVRKIAAEPRGA